ncbi:MAG: TonB-dependent receptor [Chitinophagaceae bacterium]|nr:TonB-dependent receptor [Chitinophagaceae bacterium]
MKMKFFVLAALIISSTAHAQDSSSSILEEVIVTANKIPQKQSTTGKVITVITRQELEKSSGRTVGQLLNDQAGLTINGALNNPGTNQVIYSRGASAGRTLILLDGIPVYDPSFISNDFDINLLSLNDIERIEIARGAQSTLYGSDAVGGVINIITVKKDVSKPLNAKATVTGGSYGTLRTNLQVYGKLKKLKYTTRYARLKSDGFSAAYDSSGKGNFDRDSYRGDVSNASLQYDISNAFSIRSFVQYSQYKNEFDATLFKDEDDYAGKNNNLFTGAGFTYQKPGVRITANYQYMEINRNYRNDSFDIAGFSKFSTDDYFGRNQFAEVYANISLGKGFTLLNGADYRFSGMNNQNYSLSNFGGFKSEFKDTVHSQASLYASLLYNSPNEKLNVEAGGRLNVHSRYGSNHSFTINPSYSINQYFRVFGSVATAFKAPSLYQLYSAYGNLNLKPERSLNFEIGIQQQHQQLQNRVVFFNRVIEDGLDFDNVNFQYINFNKQTVNGIEFETNWRPVNGFNVSVNYTFLDIEEQTQSRETFGDTTYNYSLKRPRNSLNARIGYEISPKLFLSASGKFAGKRYDVGGYQAADEVLESYFIASAYAEYKLKPKLKLFADAQNLFNKKFFDIRGYRSIPFMFNGGVTLEL